MQPSTKLQEWIEWDLSQDWIGLVHANLAHRWPKDMLAVAGRVVIAQCYGIPAHQRGFSTKTHKRLKAQAWKIMEKCQIQENDGECRSNQHYPITPLRNQNVLCIDGFWGYWHMFEPPCLSECLWLKGLLFGFKGDIPYGYIWIKYCLQHQQYFWPVFSCSRTFSDFVPLGRWD